MVNICIYKWIVRVQNTDICFVNSLVDISYKKIKPCFDYIKKNIPLLKMTGDIPISTPKSESFR